MTDIRNSSLAVIAAGIAGTTFTGLDQFSYEIYRGKNYTGNPRKFSLQDAFMSAMEQVTRLVDIQASQPSIIVMNKRLEELSASTITSAPVTCLVGSTLDEVYYRSQKMLDSKIPTLF